MGFLGMGIFHFGLDQKIPGDLGFLSPGIGDFQKFGNLYPRGLGICENLGIFIPGIGDFFKSGD